MGRPPRYQLQPDAGEVAFERLLRTLREDRDRAQDRYARAAWEAAKAGVPVRDIAEWYGITLSTAYTIIARHEARREVESTNANA